MVGRYGTTLSLSTSDCSGSCEAGRYSVAGSFECSLCDAGRYGTNGISCDGICPVGSYSIRGNGKTSSCTPCPIGRFGASAGLTNSSN